MAGKRIYVLVRAGRRPGAARAIMRWVRLLVPAAVLLSTPAALPPEAEEGASIVISIDADEVISGPLALADAIARGHARHAAASGSTPRPA